MDELVRRALECAEKLRELLPEKVDYASIICAEPHYYGACYVWEDPEPYVMEEAADLLVKIAEAIQDAGL